MRALYKTSSRYAIAYWPFQVQDDIFELVMFYKDVELKKLYNFVKH